MKDRFQCEGQGVKVRLQEGCTHLSCSRITITKETHRFVREPNVGLAVSAHTTYGMFSSTIPVHENHVFTHFNLV